MMMSFCAYSIGKQLSATVSSEKVIGEPIKKPEEKVTQGVGSLSFFG